MTSNLVFNLFSFPIFLSSDAVLSMIYFTFSSHEDKKATTKCKQSQLSRGGRDHFLLTWLKKEQVELSESKKEK